MFALLRQPVPGTGLRTDAFVGLALASIAAFAWWGGALWRAPASASHVGRFAGSYLLVIPAAALVLVLGHAWSVGHLAATVGAVWAIKMVATSILFVLVSRGTGQRYEPKAAIEAHGSPDADLRRAAEEADDEVIEAGRGEPPVATLEIRAGVTVPARVDVPVGATIEIRNHDGELHTALLVRRSRTLANVPLAPRTSTRLGPFPEGETELRCAHHPAERAHVVASARPEVPSP